MPRLLRTSTLRARALRRRSTPAEEALWQLVRGRKLGVKFRRQQPIDRYIVDFFCKEAGLVIEVDGAGHYPRPHSDVVRDTFLESVGLTVLRFENIEVLEHPEAVIARIREDLHDPLQWQWWRWGEDESC